MAKIFFHPSLLLLFLYQGSGMGKNQDPGSVVNIPDPQHCENQCLESTNPTKTMWLEWRYHSGRHEVTEALGNAYPLFCFVLYHSS
jgi:hypothetical protein